MATARELLEQADALMRRNRLRGTAPAALAVEQPVLAAVAAAGGATPANETHGDVAADAMAQAIVSSDFAGPAATAESPQIAALRETIDDFDDVPVLTDAISDRDPISVIGPEEGGEPSIWPEDPQPPVERDGWSSRSDVDAPSDTAAPAESAEGVSEPIVDARLESTDGAPAQQSAVDGRLLADAMPQLISAGIGDAVPHEAVESAADAHEVPGEDDAGAPRESETDEPALAVDRARSDALAVDRARSDTLAEEVRIQVLQRLDIFTDTGLREQLTARLTPIVDRASADLVAAINQHLGTLLRAYVAEAIEREIEKLRRSDGF